MEDFINSTFSGFGVFLLAGIIGICAWAVRQHISFIRYRDKVDALMSEVDTHLMARYRHKVDELKEDVDNHLRESSDIKERIIKLEIVLEKKFDTIISILEKRH